MSEEVEIETHELQEHIDEAHHEEEHGGSAWTRYVAVSTAAFAAFAAVGALQSGALVNEGMMDQLRASDKWGEYQSDRQKTHFYTLAANVLLDGGAVARPAVQKLPKSTATSPTKPKSAEAEPKKAFGPKDSSGRLREYLDTVDREAEKADDLSKQAKNLEKESEHTLVAHERFAYSVALLQVAIALGAVAALTRNKTVWVISGVAGVGGIVYFVLGFVTR